MICRYPGYSKKHFIVIPKRPKTLSGSYFFKYKLLQKFDFVKTNLETIKDYKKAMAVILGVIDKRTTKC